MQNKVSSLNRSSMWPPCILLGIVLAGGIVRFLLAYSLPFQGNECGTMRWICSSSQYILMHYQTWLTMNIFILLEKMIASIFGEGFIAMRFISIVAGTGTILITAFLAARLLAQKSLGFVAAALVAANPYLIQHSVFARSYAAFIFFAVLLWLMFLRWRDNPDWNNSIGLAATSLLTILFHFNGALLIVWLLVVVLLEVFRTRHDSEKLVLLWMAIKRLIIPMVFFIGVAAIFYFQLFREIPETAKRYRDTGFSLFDCLEFSFSTYFGDTLKVMPWLFLVFLLAGMFRIYKDDRYKFFWMILWIAIPISVLSVLGYSFVPWNYARYVVFILPVLIIICAGGIEYLVTLFSKRTQGWLLMLVIFVIVLAWLPGVAKQFEHGRQNPYNKVFNYMSERRQEGDRILGIDPFTLLLLSPYMQCKERRAACDPLPRENTPLLLQNTEAGRVFLVSYTTGIPAFGVETAVFGHVKVSILPPETQTDRYARLLKGYQQAARYLPDEDRSHLAYFVYSSLAYMAKLRGDEKLEKRYNKIVGECKKNFRKNREGIP